MKTKQIAMVIQSHNAKEFVNFLLQTATKVANHEITNSDARVISSLAQKIVRTWSLQLQQNKQLGIIKPILFLLP